MVVYGIEFPNETLRICRLRTEAFYRRLKYDNVCKCSSYPWLHHRGIGRCESPS